MRKTKIVCTIGPASSSEEVFAEMCKAGLNVARLNFSHGTHEEHQQKFDMIHKVRKALGLPIAVPKNYFPNDDDTQPPLVTWRGHANLLFSNWLNYFVYQTTPFDIQDIRYGKRTDRDA